MGVDLEQSQIRMKEQAGRSGKISTVGEQGNFSWILEMPEKRLYH